MIEPGRIIANYVVERHVGGGGMAEVYRVRHRVLHSVHALKVLHAERGRSTDIRARFLSEGRVQAQLRHTHIANVTDVVVDEGVAGLVMEFFAGGSLEDRLQARVAPVAPEVAIELMGAVLDALQHAHDRGVIHRDLKPANLMFRSHGLEAPILCDFGIAKLAGDAVVGARARPTRTGVVLGTPGYMSPEQVRGESELGPASDLFAAAVILWELLTGTSPFRGGGDFEVMQAIVEDRRPRLIEIAPGLPPGVAAAVERALRSDASERFATASQFSAALVQGLADGGGDPHAPLCLPEAADRVVPNTTPLDPDRVQDVAPTIPAVLIGAPESPAPAASDELWRVALLGVAALGAVTLAIVAGVGLVWWDVFLEGGAPGEPVRPEPIDLPYDLVRISSPGPTRVGSQPDEPGRDADESVATVRVQPFLLGATEVSQGLWEQVMGTVPTVEATHDWQGDPSSGVSCALYGVGDDLPVSCMSWFEALRFCNRMSNLEGLEPVYTLAGTKVTWDPAADGYRLPTEAEWEVAARAGGQGRFGPADTTVDLCSQAVGATERTGRAWPALAVPDELPCVLDPGPRSVASRAASPWGTHDMIGNAAEWVWDVYYPEGLTVVDPAATARLAKIRRARQLRVVRGGSWASGEAGLRVASRTAGLPSDRSAMVGLRLARSLPGTGPD